MKEFFIKNKKTIFIIIGIILFITIVYLLTSNPKVKSSNRSLAECLKDKGVKFYGTSWCGYCKNQKAMFGSDANNLPYIECESGNGISKQCMDAGISGFPTWIFPNGKRQSGQVSIEQLKKLSGC